MVKYRIAIILGIALVALGALYWLALQGKLRPGPSAAAVRATAAADQRITQEEALQIGMAEVRAGSVCSNDDVKDLNFNARMENDTWVVDAWPNPIENVAVFGGGLGFVIDNKSGETLERYCGQ